MKRILFLFLFIIISVLFISCDKCIEVKEVDCSGIVFDKHYKSSWVQPIVHSTGKVTSVTYVTHPAQYNVYFYATPMNVRIEGQINNKTLYNNCSNGDILNCYYIQRTYQKKDDSRYMTFSDLRLRYYFDED